jgi:hypothetical protein
MNKLCPSCQVEKPLTDYYYRTIGEKKYPFAYCKPCQRTKSRATKGTNKEHATAMREYRKSPQGQLSRFKTRARNLGLAPEEIEKAVKYFVEHDGLCDICKDKVSGRIHNLCIDHCHDRLVFRGLLCFKCNALLGMARDDEQLLLNAIVYLKR